MASSDVTTQIIFGILGIVVALVGVLIAYTNRNCVPPVRAYLYLCANLGSSSPIPSSASNSTTTQHHISIVSWHMHHHGLTRFMHFLDSTNPPLSTATRLRVACRTLRRLWGISMNVLILTDITRWKLSMRTESEKKGRRGKSSRDWKSNDQDEAMQQGNALS